ncbi:hypothetical protein C4D60_Mb09t25210 [Musa balbisiana]|uniref:Uncharacterized protein n=1 Tax=Musa balbisiana TaxID=52838 RepID=A0A4S8IJ22_MUSBA|nr:hypothetical protein C4D60_Mb09t25210 [Musa balbisiana]
MPQHFMLTLMMSNLAEAAYGHEAPSLLPTGDSTHGFFKSKISTAGPAKLCMHMRQEDPPLCGRDHMAFRSAYFPVKLPTLPPADLQRKIGDELDRTPGEILKKLEDLYLPMDIAYSFIR